MKRSGERICFRNQPLKREKRMVGVSVPTWNSARKFCKTAFCTRNPLSLTYIARYRPKDFADTPWMGRHSLRGRQSTRCALSVEKPVKWKLWNLSLSFCFWHYFSASAERCFGVSQQPLRLYTWAGIVDRPGLQFLRSLVEPGWRASN